MAISFKLNNSKIILLNKHVCLLIDKSLQVNSREHSEWKLMVDKKKKINPYIGMHISHFP